MRSLAILSSPEAQRQRLDSRIAAFERGPWRYSIRMGLLFAVVIGVAAMLGAGRFDPYYVIGALVLGLALTVLHRYTTGPRLRALRDRLFPDPEPDHPAQID